MNMSLGPNRFTRDTLGREAKLEAIPLSHAELMLHNSCRLELGILQNGDTVGSVRLPPWAHGDVGTFVRKHCDALESAHTSQRLSEWIDLIFGYAQRGPRAVAATNVYVHLTYAGAVDLASISDPVAREATQAQIAFFGQSPVQLFSRPHPARSAIGSGRFLSSAVEGLRLQHADRVSVALKQRGSDALRVIDNQDAKLVAKINTGYEKAGP